MKSCHLSDQSRRAVRACRMSVRIFYAALVSLLTSACAFAAPALVVTNGTFLTMKRGQETALVGYMVIDGDGRIATIAAGEPPAAIVAAAKLDVAGKIIVPGFISAHSHVWQSALRGLGANQYVRGWGQAVRVYSSHASDEDIYWFTLHGALDHLRHGITSVYNFGYSQGPHDNNGEQFRALADSGMRFVHSYAPGRDRSPEQRYAEFKGFYDAAKPSFADPKFLRLAISGTAASLAEVQFDKRLMDQYGLLNETHFLELPLNKESQQANFQYFMDAGTLGPNQFFGHYIHTTEDMLRKTAAAGSGMSWNPLSNGRLASGIADIPKYLSLGVKVGMGVDGQASADLPDPFENMRVGLYFIRAKYQDAAIMQPIDVLRLHTLGSAEVMGIADKVGSLEPGKFADFVVVSPSGGIDRAPVFDPYATVVFACNTANVDAVYVGGKKLVNSDLSLTQADMTRASAEVEKRVGRLRRTALNQ